MKSFMRGLDGEGRERIVEQPISQVNAPSFGVDLAWSGAEFGAVWSDARLDDNYEVYFSLFSPMGDKLIADVRVTDAEDFSIHSRILYDQGRFLVVFDDRRDEALLGYSRVFGQLITSSGAINAPNIALSLDGENAEYPALAATEQRLGLVYTVLDDMNVGLRFRSFDKDFEDPSPPLLVAFEQVREPRIVAVGGNFLVTWDVYGDGPGDAIWGSLISQTGQMLIAPRPLTGGAAHARSHDTLSLGDRTLFTWADDLAGNYELYAQTLSVDLEVLEPRTRLTDHPSETLAPYTTLGDAGRVGVLFDDWREGTHGAYFLTLGCPEAGFTGR